MNTAMNGNTRTESTPAPTSAAAFSGSIVPLFSPISVRATTSGSVVAINSISWVRSRLPSARR